MNDIARKKKILIIDDEELILDVSTEILGFLGYECFTAGDGERAQEIAREQNPDLILCDYYLPEMPGEKILENLKNEFPECRVLIASGRELNEDEHERMMEKGAMGFLGKPYTMNELKEAVEKHIA
jgi:two-component system alkaline phosphatase synthesis response regulator PhoP